jgi:UDP-glucuronate decarboxylase
VISNFVLQALRGQDITIYGEGQQTRSFCFVDDLVDGLVALMERPGFDGPVNLGNPIELTIREVAEKVLELTKSTSRLIRMPLPEDDPRHRQPDISKAQRLLGFAPKVGFDEGLARTVEDFRRRLADAGE